MPYLMVQTSHAVEQGARDGLLLSLSKKVAELLGKPESYVMVALEANTAMSMGGALGATAFFELRSIGDIDADKANALSAGISEILSGTLGVSSDRIFGNFVPWKREMWAMGGKTL